MVESVFDYLQNPLTDLSDCKFFSQENYEQVKKLLSVFGGIYFYKKRILKRLVTSLTPALNLSQPPFTVTKEFCVKAYMHDCGKLFISRGAIIKLSKVSLLSVICHELAHLWLAKEAEYGKLKEINKAFIEKFKGTENVTPLTPIEFYATYYSIKLLEDFLGLNLSKRIIKNLNGVIENLKVKLNDYLILIKGLKN